MKASSPYFSFAHRRLCPAAIFLRVAAEIVRLPLALLPSAANASSIRATSFFARCRSASNCWTTPDRFVIWDPSEIISGACPTYSSCYAVWLRKMASARSALSVGRGRIVCVARDATAFGVSASQHSCAGFTYGTSRLGSVFAATRSRSRKPTNGVRNVMRITTPTKERGEHERFINIPLDQVRLLPRGLHSCLSNCS
jgi:hypothetical protein